MAQIRCPQCGNFIDNNAVRCKFCGALNYADPPDRQPSYPAQPQQQMGYNPNTNQQMYQGVPSYPQQGGYSGYHSGISQEEAILQSQEMHYLIGEDQYHSYTENFRKSASFNVAAFFFYPGWFCYRKMYMYGAISIMITWLVNAFAIWINIWWLFFGLLLNITAGCIANILYKTWLTDKYRMVAGASGYEKERVLKSAGGTNMPAGIVFCILGYLINIILTIAIILAIGAGVALFGIASELVNSSNNFI